jgi:putative peptide-modifying radical SAM enzyme
MLFIIITTPACNLKCNYCGGTMHGMPSEIKYDLNTLKKFISQYKNPTVAFYGGEPLLRADIVKKMIDTLPAKHFVINTNGYYITKLKNYLHKFDTILLSIDGRQNTTDYYRGEGCYNNVLKALNYLKTEEFPNEIIGRMTVSCKTNIYNDVQHVLQHFPKVHWQLDAVWSKMWNLQEFKKWTNENYKPGIKKLINWWIKNIKKDNTIAIIPFIGIISRMLHKTKGLPCQSGNKSITINTDGKIMACPIAPEYNWNNLGDINKGFKKALIQGKCKNCEIKDICGGRCLFFNREHLWGEEGFEAVCNTTKFLIKELKKHQKLFENKKDEFYYPKYNNTTEIIP